MEWYYYILILLAIGIGLMVLYWFIRSYLYQGYIPFMSEIIDPHILGWTRVGMPAGRDPDAHKLSTRKKQDLIDEYTRRYGKKPNKELNRYELAVKILKKGDKTKTEVPKTTPTKMKQTKQDVASVRERLEQKPKDTIVLNPQNEFELVDQNTEKDGTITMMFEPDDRQRLDHYGNQGEGWDERGWTKDYVNPTHKKIKNRTKGIKGVKNIEIGEKGYVYIEIKR